MKQLEHLQKMQLERAEHLLRIQIYSHQLAYFRGSTVESTTSTSVQSVQSPECPECPESRVQDDSPVSPESPEARAQSPASG